SGCQLGCSPAVADGVVYVGTDSWYLYALDAVTGALKWSYNAGGPIESSPVVAKGMVYMGDRNNGVIRALDASSGKPKWAYATGQPITASPAVANGVVYIGSHNGRLYAL